MSGADIIAGMMLDEQDVSGKRYRSSGRSRVTEFTCSRCGKTAREFDFMTPANWLEVLKWDLCDKCSLKLVQWIEGKGELEGRH